MAAPTQIWPPEFAERYRAAGYWTGETFGELLAARAKEYGDTIAIIDETNRWTYSELDKRASVLAGAFLEMGIKPGDRVIVHLPNVAQFFSVVFGLFRAGILPVFALPAHRESEIQHFARTSGAVAYIVAEKHEGFSYLNLAKELPAQCETIKNVVVFGNEGALEGMISLAELENSSPSDVSSSVPTASDVAFLQLSGGSTGLSKLIPRTHDDYLYSVRASAEICRLDTSTVYLGALPIAHNYPMSSPGTFGTLYAGGTVVLSPSPAPDVAFPIIERERVTFTGVVPPIALVWLQAAGTTKYDLSSLEVLQVGGAKLTPEVARRIEPALGVRLQQVFGMAEGLVNYTRLDDSEYIRINTQGRPISVDDEILIVDENDVPVAPGTPGNLLTRGPYTIRGYYNAPDANAQSFTADGYYRTGDIVVQLEGGYLEVRGRATDHINRGGEKVSAEEVEDHLLAHPEVHDVALVALADDYLGEKSCAFVIPRPGTSPKAAKLKAWLRGRGIAAYKIPDRVIFVDSFPATGVGKVSRKDLRAAIRASISQDGKTLVSSS